MSHMATLITLPKDILRLIVATMAERDFLSLRRASAVFYRWSLAPHAPWTKLTEVWDDRFSVSQAGSVLQSHDTSPIPRFAPHWRMRAMVEAFCVSDVWKNAERIKRIVQQAKALLESERTLVSVPAPVTIINGPYGRWEALKRLLLIAGGPVECPLLFMGPYAGSTAVDEANTKTLILIWLLKITYPDRVTLLPQAQIRSRPVITVPSNSSMQEPIDWMPKAAVIASKIICLPGGISREHMNLGLMDVPKKDPATNRPSFMRRSRPVQNDELAKKVTWRQVGRHGYRDFGSVVTEKFLRDNDLYCLVMTLAISSVPYLKWIHNKSLLAFHSTAAEDLSLTFVRVLASDELSVVTLIK